MIETARFTIRIASDEEMRNLIANKDDEDMKRAYGDMLEQCMANPEQRKWYAAWMIESPKGERIGDLCLKGLASNGAVEIGYGLLLAYWGKRICR